MDRRGCVVWWETTAYYDETSLTEGNNLHRALYGICLGLGMSFFFGKSKTTKQTNATRNFIEIHKILLMFCTATLDSPGGTTPRFSGDTKTKNDPFELFLGESREAIPPPLQMTKHYGSMDTSPAQLSHTTISQLPILEQITGNPSSF